VAILTGSLPAFNRFLEERTVRRLHLVELGIRNAFEVQRLKLTVIVYSQSELPSVDIFPPLQKNCVRSQTQLDSRQLQELARQFMIGIKLEGLSKFYERICEIIFSKTLGAVAVGELSGVQGSGFQARTIIRSRFHVVQNSGQIVRVKAP